MHGNAHGDGAQHTASSPQVAEALSERAQRIYDKYGNIMLDTAGMSKAGVERKATCRALFSKMLYLAECEELLKQGAEAEAKADVPAIFGATEDDTAKLRIASLYEVRSGVCIYEMRQPLTTPAD